MRGASNGTFSCWGLNNQVELGYGHQDAIGDGGQRVVDFAVGGYHSCAQVESGEVYCWGLNRRGQLGYGTTDDAGDDEPPTALGPVSIW